MKLAFTITSVVAGLMLAAPAFAYDGTHCKAPGNCWEPKPGFPAVIKGTKYDNKLDPNEVAKQDKSEREMEARNAQRVENLHKTGKFVYDVRKIGK